MCDRQGVTVCNINNLGIGKKNTTQNNNKECAAHREQMQTSHQTCEK